MRVVFGGTFDPVHIGHLRMATELAFALSVDHVHLMPCYRAVHKANVAASAAQRLAMLELCVASDERLCIDDREIKRGEPSYTIDSLRAIRSEDLNATSNDGTVYDAPPICIAMGSDSAAGLPHWKGSNEFLSLAHIVIIERPSDSALAGELQIDRQLEAMGFVAAESLEALKQSRSGKYFRIKLTALDVSSTMIRESVAMKKSIRYLVTDAVDEYICDNALYLHDEELLGKMKTYAN